MLGIDFEEAAVDEAERVAMHRGRSADDLANEDGVRAGIYALNNSTVKGG